MGSGAFVARSFRAYARRTEVFVPPRLIGAEREAAIRRKLEAGIEFNRTRILGLSSQTKLLHAGDITAYLAAADEWIRGERERYPRCQRSSEPVAVERVSGDPRFSAAPFEYFYQLLIWAPYKRRLEATPQAEPKGG